MKAPEEYLFASKEREAQRHGHATFSRIRLVGTDEQIKVLEASAIAALKSMQSDHEKELIEFHLFICKLYNKPDDSLCTYLNTASEEAITQFRNKQQDR